MSAWSIDKTIIRVIGSLAEPQGVDRRTLFDLNGARGRTRHQEHFRRRQARTLTHNHRVRAGSCVEPDEITTLAVHHRRQAAHHQTGGPQGIQIAGAYRHRRRCGTGLGSVRNHLDGVALHRYSGTESTLRGFKTPLAIKGEPHVFLTGDQLQLQGFGVGFKGRTRDAQARSVSAHEVCVTGFVVLGIPAQYRRRRDDHLARQAVANAGVGNRQEALG